MDSKDLLYDVVVDLELTLDEARAIFRTCSLDEHQQSELQDLIRRTEDRCEIYQAAFQSEDHKTEEMFSQAKTELDKLSEAVMQWSEKVKHEDLLLAIKTQSEELLEIRSQLQDVLDRGDLPSAYQPGLEDMVDDITGRIEEYALLSSKEPIESVEALGELTIKMVIFSDSLAQYKRLADSENLPEE